MFWYATAVHKIASDQATAVAKQNDPKAGPIDIGDIPQNDQNDPQIAHLYDQMLSAASIQVMQMATQSQVIQRANQTMQHLQQMLKSMQPPPPMDPSQVGMAQVQADRDKAQADDKTKQTQIEQQGKDAEQGNQAKLVIAQQHEAAETQRKREGDLVKQITTREDNETALQIHTEDLAAGKKSNVSNGESVGKEK